ncbi:MAG: LamB/YcsF family protein [Saprospiraceae bacterium]|nr:LamB/YcsF family protein [Saprospiraceae bacterium]
MAVKEIDINCDMGESFGDYSFGSDEKIFPYITSCNVACGFHAGDPVHIEQTLRQAKAHGVKIGAHPSYPDLKGFGRRYLKMAPAELYASVKYQISAIKGMAESMGMKLSYVKPHGALYHVVSDDESEAHTMLQAIRDIDDQLYVVGLAGSPMKSIADQASIKFVSEAFADRRYMPNGRLLPRTIPGAVLIAPSEVAAQVVSLVMEQRVLDEKNEYLTVEAETICLHSDHPKIHHIVKAIDEALAERNIPKLAFSS